GSASACPALAQPPADPNAELPIGPACGGQDLLVLDDQLQAVRPREIGDLYIRGAGLTPGYWRDLKRTAAAFVFSARGAGAGDRLYRTGDLARIGDDGLVYLVGRAASEIDGRQRIGIGEIEAALGTIEVMQGQ